MAEDKTLTRVPIPEFEMPEDIAAFWGKHSTADSENITHEVHFEVKLSASQQPVRLLPELGETLEAIAREAFLWRHW